MYVLAGDLQLFANFDRRHGRVVFFHLLDFLLELDHLELRRIHLKELRTSLEVEGRELPAPPPRPLLIDCMRAPNQS